VRSGSLSLEKKGAKTNNGFNVYLCVVKNFKIISFLKPALKEVIKKVG
jgi:hypothetical protein